MTLSIHAVGTAATGTSTCSPAYPAVSGGDLKVCAVVRKSGSTPSPSFNRWNAQGSGGAGTAGADSGNVSVNFFADLASGSESGTETVNNFGGTGNSLIATLLTLSCAAGKTFDVRAKPAADGTAGTAFSASTDVGDELDLQVGDLVLVIAGTNTDARTYSAHGLSASGITFGARTVHRSAVTANGNDCAMEVFSAFVTSGSESSVTVTATMTASGTTANQNAGAAVIVRIREVDATPLTILGGDIVEWYGDGIYNAPSIPADLGDPIYYWESELDPSRYVYQTSVTQAVFGATPAGYGAVEFPAAGGQARLDHDGPFPLAAAPSAQIVFFADVYVPASTSGPSFFLNSSSGQDLGLVVTSGKTQLTFNTATDTWRLSTSTLAVGWHSICFVVAATSGACAVYVDGVVDTTFSQLAGSYLVPDLSDASWDVQFLSISGSYGDDSGKFASFGWASRSSGSFSSWQLSALEAYQAALLVAPPSADGAAALSSLAASGIAVTLFTATGAGALSPLAGTGAAVERFTSTGAGALSPLAGTGAAVERFTSTGNAALSPLAGGGTCTETFSATGSAACSSLAGSGTASENFSATGSGTCSSLAASATATESFNATGSSACSPLAGTGNAAENFSSSGDAAVSPLAGSGNASEAFSSTGTGAVSPLAGTGTSAEEFNATGGGAVSPLAGSGTGSESFSGDGSGALSPLAASGVGENTDSFAADGSAAVSPFAANGSSVQTFGATGTGAVSPFSALGSGEYVHVGVGSAALSPLAASGVAVSRFEATGTGAFSPFAGSGISSESFSAAATAVISSLAGVGGALESFFATGTVALSPLTSTGIADNGVSDDRFAVGNAALSPFAASGGGSESMAATGSADMSITANATGVESFSAVGTGSLSPLACTGVGLSAFTSVGNAAMSSLSAGGSVFWTADVEAEGTAQISSFQAHGGGIWQGVVIPQRSGRALPESRLIPIVVLPTRPGRGKIKPQ